jgi:hypothetical protein
VGASSETIVAPKIGEVKAAPNPPAIPVSV